MSLQFLTPTFIIAILIALSIHEWAHGFVAYKLGDPTAKHDGRLTLNPIAHLDPIGTAMFVLVGFGWGKPVPVDPRYFKNYKRDTALVSLAGPASNLLLAFIAFVLMTAVLGENAMFSTSYGTEASVTTQLFRNLMTDLIQINLILMAFNLLPIAPLDGSKIIQIFIPPKYDNEYQTFLARGPQILLILILLSMFLNLPVFSVWISLIISPIIFLFSSIAGFL
ncbi:MAG: site-2 protease family protein [Candidatus Peribacteraceae bacterium]|nr:site-2 protease family protein [Candidatus Peribacteraceae bacterium]